LEVGNVFREN
jgi:hypothetical protein